VPTAGPDDTAVLARALDDGLIRADSIVGIMGKTEGNGCVNDFTRGYATLTLKLLLAERLGCGLADVERRVALEALDDERHLARRAACGACDPRSTQPDRELIRW